MDKNIYINDLLKDYPNKSILEIYDILLKMGINNKKIKIKVKCRVCGCDVVVTPSIYKKQKSFACEEHINHKPKGKDSAFYNRIETNCSYCGKKIEITPYEFNKKNSFGDSNHFCSQECYWKFRSEYYRGEKGAMYQHEYTDEQKENIIRGVVKRLKSIDFVNTSIQIKVNNILDELFIEYEREYPFVYYAVDNYLTDYNLIIEVMGDYWHGNPLIYNENGSYMNKIQSKTILKDKQKRGYIQKYYGFPILNLWERDIRNDIDKCKALIVEFIHHKGYLENYNSFNYSYVNNTLILNNDIIIPYHDMTSEQYSHLIKKIS